jgi:hypothetical protein
VVAAGNDPAATTVRIYGAGKVPSATTVTTALGAPFALALAPLATVFRQLADMNGDGLDDLLVLQRAGDARYQIWVATATGDGFASPALWWDSALSDIPFDPTTVVRFVAGDFTGDGRVDAGLLVSSATPLPPTPAPTEPGASTPGASAAPSEPATPGPSAIAGASELAPSESASPPGEASPTPGPTRTPLPSSPPTPLPAGPAATLWVLAGTGNGFLPPVPSRTGPLVLDGGGAFAGDVDGDSRADLIVQLDLAAQPVPGTGTGTGIREVVVRTGAPNGSAPEVWIELPDLPAAGAKTVVADINRDGRADLVIDRALGATGSTMVGLLSTGGSFTARTLWSNSGKFRWSASRIASADVNGDGRDDLVVLYNAGAAGSRFYQFLSTGTSLRPAGSTIDPGLPWAGAALY